MRGGAALLRGDLTLHRVEALLQGRQGLGQHRGDPVLLVGRGTGGIVEPGLGLLDPACHGFERDGGPGGLVLGLTLALGRDGSHQGFVIPLGLGARRGRHPGDQAVEIAAGPPAQRRGPVVRLVQNGRRPFLKAHAGPARRGRCQLAGIKVQVVRS